MDERREDATDASIGRLLHAAQLVDAPAVDGSDDNHATAPLDLLLEAAQHVDAVEEDVQGPADSDDDFPDNDEQIPDVDPVEKVSNSCFRLVWILHYHVIVHLTPTRISHSAGARPFQKAQKGGGEKTE